MISAIRAWDLMPAGDDVSGAITSAAYLDYFVSHFLYALTKERACLGSVETNHDKSLSPVRPFPCMVNSTVVFHGASLLCQSI